MQKTKSIIPLLLFVGVLAFAMIPQTMATLPNGNGIQYINEHIHATQDESLFYVRGYYYSIIFPEEFSGQIISGTWLTLGWGVYREFVPEALLEMYIAADIEMIKTSPLYNPLGLTFEGEEINIEDCWRFDDVVVIPQEELNPEDPSAPGTYYYYIPFRYYIPPRNPGHYDIIGIYAGVPLYVGYVEWVLPNQL